MLKRILGVAGLAIAIATTANAQIGPQTTTMFQYTSGGPYSNGDGDPLSMRGKLTAAPIPEGSNWVVGNTFEVWCVDQRHYVSSSPISVDISRMDGPATTTRTGDMNRYQKAAYFASTMTTANKFTNQYVMWAIMHGKTASNSCNQWDGSNFSGPAFTNSDPLETCNSAAIYAAANTAAPVSHPEDWFVITGGGDAGRTTQSGGVQELIAHCTPLPGSTDCSPPLPPNEENPTPEPATMSLLALGLTGLAGAGFRRRRKTV